MRNVKELNKQSFFHSGASLVAHLVKKPPAMRETWVWPLGWEDPREKGKATHASILAWRIPWTEEPGGLQSMGLQRVRHDWATKHSTSYASTKFYKEKRDGDGHSLAHIWEHRVTSKWANISSVFSHFLFLSCSSIVHFSLLSSLPFSPGFQRRTF